MDDNFCSPDFDCFGAEEDVVCYDAVVEVASSDAVEVATCSDAEEVACYDVEEVAHRQQQTSTAAGYGGDYGIVSDGDDINREPFYDLVTQLPQDDTCLQYPAESIDQGLFCDIMEEQQFPNFEASVEDCDYLDVRWRTVTSLTLRWRTVTSLTLRWRTVHAMMLMRTMATMLWTTPLTR